MIARTVAVLLLALAAVARAGEPLNFDSGDRQVRLLELYTSEGCSSCPPADRWLGGLVDDQRLWRELVPVAFHVDYWDYIGWPDRFAAPSFGARQRAHAGNGYVRTVYTPGFVLDGREWRGWFRRQPLPDALRERVGTLSVTLDGDGVTARFAPAASHGALELHLAVLGFGLSSEVRAGENHGRTLAHDFVVLGHRRIAMHHAQEVYTSVTRLPAAGVEAPRLALAAWVSPAGDTAPLQATGGWLGERAHRGPVRR
jgi:hypothetical protein